MNIFLEILRVAFITLLLGALLGGLVRFLYSFFGANTEPYILMGDAAVIIIIYVLYTNKFQFSGWYRPKGKSGERLSKGVTRGLSGAAALLILLPIVINVIRLVL